MTLSSITSPGLFPCLSLWEACYAPINTNSNPSDMKRNFLMRHTLLISLKAIMEFVLLCCCLVCSVLGGVFISENWALSSNISSKV